MSLVFGDVEENRIKRLAYQAETSAVSQPNAAVSQSVAVTSSTPRVRVDAMMREENNGGRVAGSIVTSPSTSPRVDLLSDRMLKSTVSLLTSNPTLFVLVARTTMQSVLDLLEKVDKLPFSWEFLADDDLNDNEQPPNKINGRLIAYELPHPAHEVSNGTILSLVQEQLTPHVRALDVISVLPSPQCRIGLRLKEPDMSILPKGLQIGLNGVLSFGFGKPFPNFIVESAFSENVGHMIQSCQAWISPLTSVQVAIGINIEYLADPVTGWRAMEAYLFRRGIANWVRWEFGTDVNLPVPWAVGFPLSVLFVGVPLGSLNAAVAAQIQAGAQISIDLALLQREILLML
jgi:hypothetical protein